MKARNIMCSTRTVKFVATEIFERPTACIIPTNGGNSCEFIVYLLEFYVLFHFNLVSLSDLAQKSSILLFYTDNTGNILKSKSNFLLQMISLTTKIQKLTNFSSPLSKVKSKYPTVAYHPAITEHDTDWQPHTRETRHDVTERARKFFHWLLHQPHDNIAVVSHGVWIECALREYCPEVLDFGNKRVYNCEVYCGNLVGRKMAMGNDENCGTWNDLEIGLNDVTQIGFYHA